MLRTWTRTLVATVISAALAGCAATTVTGSDAPAVTPTPCSKECSDKEVDDTGCNKNAIDAIKGVQVVVGEARGTLALRKASPSICKQIFWAHFYPEKGSTGDFQLTTEYPGYVSKVQESQPGNPELEAYTVGVYVDLGMKVRGCIASGGQTKCIETTVV